MGCGHSSVVAADEENNAEEDSDSDEDNIDYEVGFASYILVGYFQAQSQLQLTGIASVLKFTPSGLNI